MSGRVLLLLAVALAAGACNTWPQPPAIDHSKYEADHRAWREAQQRLLVDTLPIVGIWPLEQGETAFGSDSVLPIVLPLTGKPGRAGVFRREGTMITAIPERGAPLRLADGQPIRDAMDFNDEIWIESLRLSLADAGDDRRWLAVRDDNHPAVKNPPAVQVYPLDARWRVSARFEAFPSPRPAQVPDVRGGTMTFLALGQLVLRLSEHEERLTAFGEPGGGEFFVMFKDPTNQTTTFAGYRIVTPAVVDNGGWTVVDFNFAFNPPCAYSSFTLCPLPPPENRVSVPVEAGLKKLAS